MADTSANDLWIGLHSFHGGVFVWTDGQPKSYINLNLNVSVHYLNCAVCFFIVKWEKKQGHYAIYKDLNKIINLRKARK